MIPENRIPTHPGQILLEEFLLPLEVTPATLAKHIGVPLTHISEIVQAERGVTPRMAWLFAQALGTSPEFWNNLQSAYDLAKSHPKRQVQRLQEAAWLHPAYA